MRIKKKKCAIYLPLPYKVMIDLSLCVNGLNWAALLKHTIFTVSILLILHYVRYSAEIKRKIISDTRRSARSFHMAVYVVDIRNKTFR